MERPRRQCNRPPGRRRAEPAPPADLRGEPAPSSRFSAAVRGSPFLFQAASTGAYILGILFIFKRNGIFAISLPFHTSVAMTHSSFSSDMTYTDWYLVSFEVEYTESGLFLSEASPPLSGGALFSSPAGPWGWHLVSGLL